jgi:hypothetical protein
MGFSTNLLLSYLKITLKKSDANQYHTEEITQLFLHQF